MEGLRALSVLVWAVAIEMDVEHGRLARQLAGPEGRVVAGRGRG